MNISGAIFQLLLDEGEAADVINRAGVPDLLDRLGPQYTVIARDRLESTMLLVQGRSFSPFLLLAESELARARGLHAPLNSAHEAYAVILEELEEFKVEVFRRQRDPRAMLDELVQLAAMCARAADDLRLLDALEPE